MNFEVSFRGTFICLSLSFLRFRIEFLSCESYLLVQRPIGGAGARGSEAPPAQIKLAGILQLAESEVRLSAMAAGKGR